VGAAVPGLAAATDARIEHPGFVPASDNFLVNLAAAEAGAGAIVLGRVTHRFSRSRGIVPLDMDLGAARLQADRKGMHNTHENTPVLGSTTKSGA
jgi:hypothetical protein